MHFVTKISQAGDISVSYKNNQINVNHSINFLGLTPDTTLSWTVHIGQLIPKLNPACYVIRSLKSVMSTKELKIICFAYVHSIITFGIILWGNSPHSINIFVLQKRIIRTIMNADSENNVVNYLRS
jgi:hypothetical protein